MVSKAETDDAALTVFYDGSCPLCRAEIETYRRMQGADRIGWFDVSGCGDGDIAPNLDRDRAMRRFHVRRRDGTLISGGRAFAELWFQMPRLRFPGRMFRTGPGGWFLDRAYDLFLPVRPYLQRLMRKREG
jgi:predicted DCC family thiol-disulfide oxidoreductase YuxK